MTRLRSVNQPFAETFSSSGHTLLNPGPCNTSSRVKAAVIHHDVCHRTSEFGIDFGRLVTKLGRVFSPSQPADEFEHDVLVLTGSGTSAMEASIASFVPADKKVLVLDNGAFGERIAEICRLHELNLVHVRYGYGEVVLAADVEAAFVAHPEIEVVVLVHHETSVGLLNPVAAIGAICHHHDKLLLVDAVSSLGAEDLDVVRDHVDVCWSSANKCLHGAAGLAFVSVAPRAWTKSAGIKPRSFYLDLRRYKKYLNDSSQTPFTPAVGLVYGLEAAVDEFLEDGHEARLAMYATRNRTLREAFAAMGLRAFTHTGHESHSVVTVSLPDELTFADLDGAMRAHGFVIYDCKAPMQGSYFQVANMGILSSETLDRFLRCFATVLGELAPVARRRAASRS
ncbi:MAG: alanine--glyoxylate aminotransferase family protein [Myxococcales bacterium]|nr:alanine--glyoxylate aminotransferase family protein [Myxococcales bacterium]